MPYTEESGAKDGDRNSIDEREELEEVRPLGKKRAKRGYMEEKDDVAESGQRLVEES